MSMTLKQIKVTVVYPYIMHYRKPVFSFLADSSKDITYTFLADEESNIDSLPILKHDVESAGESLFKSWVVIKNIWFGKHVLWQGGLVIHSLMASYDVLILLGNMYYISNWFAVLFAKMRGRKVLMWTHGVREKEKGIKGIIRKFFYKLSDGLLLYGHRAKDILINDGLNGLGMYVIYNSLDLDKQKKVIEHINIQDIKQKKDLLGITQDEVVIFCIGRLTPDKNVPFLLDAVKILDNQNIKTKTIIVGDGPEKDKLVAKADSLGISDKVIIYGACYGEEEVALLHNLSDVSVMPGDIGLSVIHSMTYGVPVITHDNFARHKPEFEAIIPGSTGGFYRYGDAADLAKELMKWATKTAHEREYTVRMCKDVIDKYYNPKYQEDMISKVVRLIMQ